MTDTETELADALRACLPYVLHFKRKAKREANAGGLEHFVTKCEALLAAHDTARAQPASVADHLSRAAEPVGWQFLGTSSINGPFPAPTWKECADPVEAEKAGYEVRAIYTHPSEDARDAARYRWLRMHAVEGCIRSSGATPDLTLNCDEPASEWDAQIDAAMAKENCSGSD